MNKALIIVIFTIMISPIYGKMNSPEDFIHQKKENVKVNIHNPFVLPVHFLVRFYQVVISPIKQENCQMYPSCSHYSIACLKTHGILGVLMTVDRLNRCGHDVHNYDKIIIGNRIKYYDPIRKVK